MIRLKELRRKKDITQEELAKQLQLSPSTIGMYETGRREPDFDTLQKIADFFHVSTDSVLGRNIGLYEMRETKRVPVIGSVRCGVGGLAYEYIDEYITIDDARRPDEMRAFHAVGDSMEGDYIFDGDICIIHLQNEVPNNAIAVVVICDDLEECEGTIKHVHKEADGTIILQASNTKYPPRVFAGTNANRVHIVGEVVEVRRKLK